MSELLKKEREIVIPGEILAKGMDFLPGENSYRENDNIYSKALGLVYVSGRVIKITPLSGPYIPMVGDRVIGRVTDITMTGWRINTGIAYSGILNVKDATTRFIKKGEDLSKIIAIGDYVIVHAGFAINKIDETAALQTLEDLRNILISEGQQANDLNDQL